MRDLPFTAYDFFGYLAAGPVLLAGLDHTASTHVLGRLQHEGHLPWTHLRNLLDKVRPLLSVASA